MRCQRLSRGCPPEMTCGDTVRTAKSAATSRATPGTTTGATSRATPRATRGRDAPADAGASRTRVRVRRPGASRTRARVRPHEPPGGPGDPGKARPSAAGRSESGFRAVAGVARVKACTRARARVHAASRSAPLGRAGADQQPIPACGGQSIRSPRTPPCTADHPRAVGLGDRGPVLSGGEATTRAEDLGLEESGSCCDLGERPAPPGAGIDLPDVSSQVRTRQRPAGLRRAARLPITGMTRCGRAQTRS